MTNCTQLQPRPRGCFNLACEVRHPSSAMLFTSTTRGACCLQDTLMLDNLEQAQQLCAMHGYDSCVQRGMPLALLVKVRCVPGVGWQ